MFEDADVDPTTDDRAPPDISPTRRNIETSDNSDIAMLAAAPGENALLDGLDLCVCARQGRYMISTRESRGKVNKEKREEEAVEGARAPAGRHYTPPL